MQGLIYIKHRISQKIASKILFKLLRSSIICIIYIGALNIDSAYCSGCTGRIVNPITDICWKCIFPIHIAGIKVFPSSVADRGASSKFPICFCKKPPIPIPMPGIPVGFYEPIRLVDVTKAPMCLVSLGGISLGSSSKRGMQNSKGSAFYQVHWYIYPVIYWLELLTDFACLDKQDFDIAYLTEFDPLWNDDAKSVILNPEALLFGNILAQGACMADCASASASGSTGIDKLFWCCGCQGSIYPYTGNMASYNGGVGAAALLTSRIIAKLHREFLLRATWGKPMISGVCQSYVQPLFEKSAYRLQMTYPVADTRSCRKLGESESTWQAGREFPVKGEDFGFLVWHKRECCLGAL